MSGAGDRPFCPGTKVFARFPRYPPWPAEVMVPYGDTVPASVKRSKHPESATHLCQYFGESSFGYHKPADLFAFDAGNKERFEEEASQPKYRKVRDAWEAAVGICQSKETNLVPWSIVDAEEAKRGKKRRRDEDEGKKVRLKIVHGAAEKGQKVVKDKGKTEKVMKMMVDLERFTKPGPSLNAARALAIVRELSEMKVTVTVLEATKVGLLVNSLRKHPNEEVAIACRELRRKWSKMVRYHLAQTDSNKRKVQPDEDVKVTVRGPAKQE